MYSNRNTIHAIGACLTAIATWDLTDNEITGVDARGYNPAGRLQISSTAAARIELAHGRGGADSETWAGCSLLWPLDNATSHNGIRHYRAHVRLGASTVEVVWLATEHADGGDSYLTELDRLASTVDADLTRGVDVAEVL